MHKIILQIFKNHKSHGLLNLKLMDYTFDCHFFVDYDTIHWLMGCVKDLKLVKYHNKEAKGQKKYSLNFRTILMDFWMS
jgi:hypothetical protein